MSSLGLIIRSSIPALTSVLAGSVLILFNRWTNGSEGDKVWVLLILGGRQLNTPLNQPQVDTVSPDVCQFFGGMVFIVGLIYFRNLAMLFYKSPLNAEDKANCVWSLFLGCVVCTLGLVVCLSPINIYLMTALLYLYIFTLNLLEHLASKQLNVRPSGYVTNGNGFRLSSLGLIIRSSIPALTSVLAGSVLILLNRWMNGNGGDVVQILGGRPLNTPLNEPQNVTSLDVCQFLYGMVIVLGLIHFWNLYKVFRQYFLNPENGPNYEDSANFIVSFFLGSCIVALGLGICAWHVNIYVMLLLFYLYTLILNTQLYLKSKELNVRLSSKSQTVMSFVCRP